MLVNVIGDLPIQETTVFADKMRVSLADSPGNSKGLKSEQKRLSKSREEEQPLPRPFQLPVNFPRAVLEGLSSGCLSGKSRTKFISTVAASVFHHKSYPTKDEYNHVAEQMVEAYPFMQLGSGKGHVSYNGNEEFCLPCLIIIYRNILC